MRGPFTFVKRSLMYRRSFLFVMDDFASIHFNYVNNNIITIALWIILWMMSSSYFFPPKKKNWCQACYVKSKHSVFRRRAALVIVVVYEHATLCTSRKMFLPEFLGLQSTYRIFKLRKKTSKRLRPFFVRWYISSILQQCSHWVALKKCKSSLIIMCKITVQNIKVKAKIDTYAKSYETGDVTVEKRKSMLYCQV